MHAGGTVYKRELKPGEKLRIDTGCLVAMTKTLITMSSSLEK